MDQMNTILILSSFLLVIVYLTIIKRFKKSQYQIDDLLEEKNNHLNELADFKKKEKNPLGPLLANAQNSIILELDKNGKILKTDTNFQNLLGYSKKELIGKNIHGFLIEAPLKKDPLITSFIQRLFLAPKLFGEFDTELTTKKGEKIWVSWTNKIIYDSKKKPIKVISVGFDITQRKNLEAELKFLASVDPQTGVLNRQAFLQTGMRELRRSIRYKHPLSILLVQLKLKEGKELSIIERNNLIKQIAFKCKKTIRDVDYIGRIGEVELAILLPETAISNVLFLQKRLQNNLITEVKNLKDILNINYVITGYTKKEKSIDEIIMNAYKKLNTKKRK